MRRNGVRARPRGTVWYVRITFNAERIERRTDATSQSDAERIGRAILADLECGRQTPDAARTLVVELWSDLQRDYAINGRRLEDLAKRWLHLEPVFGRDLATDVTTPRLRRYVERRLEAGAARATVRNELAALRRAFTLGHEACRVVRVPAFPALQVDNTRRGFIEGEAFDRLLAELPPEQRVLATLAHWVGWRRGELLGLEWRQVDLATGEVRLDPGSTKNKDGRVAFLPPVALETLRAWRQVTAELERSRGVIVRHVVHRNGAPVLDHYDAWRSACERAGVPGLMLHDLRRSAARNYVRSGVPETVVMQVMGHRTRSMLTRYAIVSERDLRDAAARVQAAPSEQRADVVALG